jgi:hypothetical protein
VQDIENHVADKWQKKVAKMQTDVAKFKAQVDEINIKNMALREKLSNASSFRDQVCLSAAGLSDLPGAKDYLFCIIVAERDENGFRVHQA